MASSVHKLSDKTGRTGENSPKKYNSKGIELDERGRPKITAGTPTSFQSRRGYRGLSGSRASEKTGRH